MKDTRKTHARETFKEWAEAETGRPFGQLSDPQRSRELTRFYICKVHNPTHTEIAEDDLDAGMIDGAGDLGVDFIHRDDGRVLILQTKYRLFRRICGCDWGC
jgi:hypothetical protein